MPNPEKESTVQSAKDQLNGKDAVSEMVFEGTAKQFSEEFVVKDGQLYTLLPYTGQLKILNENAQLLSHDTYADGKLDGLSTRWWENTGKKKLEWTYGDGTPNGTKNEWYPDGSKKLKQEFQNGSPHGVEMAWFQNGKMQYEHVFKQGKPHGTWTDWGENGEMIRSLRYEDGKVVEQIYPK